LDVVSYNAYFKRIDAKPRVISPFAVANAKPPRMPGTSHRSVWVQISGSKRSTHVWAQVIDRIVSPVQKKYRNETIGQLKRPTFPLGDCTNFGDRYEIGGG